jgi:nuclease-like protein
VTREGNKLRPLLGLLFLSLALPAWAERCIAIDGDTLVCNHQKVRLTNVYAAEMNQPGGSAAKRKLQALVQNRDVGFVTHGHDRYGRILAEVYVEGRRIEQADIGPRAGRGSTWGADRHVYVRTVQAKKAK